MKKSWLLLILVLLFGCQTLKNGVGTPKSLAEMTLPPPKYDSVVIKTGWNSPYDVLTPWQRYYYNELVSAKPDTTKELPVTLHTYTIPVPTKK